MKLRTKRRTAILGPIIAIALGVASGLLSGWPDPRGMTGVSESRNTTVAVDRDAVVPPSADSNSEHCSLPPDHHPDCYVQRLNQAIARFQAHIDARFANGRQPASTSIWLEDATRDIARINLVFLAQRSIHDNPEWRNAEAHFQAAMRGHRDHLLGHYDVIQGIAREYRNPSPTRSAEDRRLVAQSWRQLQRAGVLLEGPAAQRLALIEQSLEELQQQFDDNLRHESLRYELLVEDLERLDGLPPASLALARQDARDRGFDSAWALTLNVHSLFPALHHLRDRELRKQLYQAWQRRAGGMRVGQLRDNPELMRRILLLRMERAQLLGHPHALSYQLGDSTLGSYRRLGAILDDLETAAFRQAQIELASIRQLMVVDGINAAPEPWDFQYYKARLAEINLEAGIDQPHIPSSLALNALFELSRSMWGLEFKARPPEALSPINSAVFDVYSDQQNALGTLGFDLLHRSGKRGGAWMSVLQHAHRSGRERQPAIITLQANFQDIGDGTARLSPTDVETVFHEFGHALVELLSATSHRSLAGNQLPADGLEFPALVLERFALRPIQLQQLRIDPDDRPRPSYRPQLSGLETLQQIAAIRVDLAWHRIEDGRDLDPMALQEEIVRSMRLPSVLTPHASSPGYREQFVRPHGGLLYRRLWANVLAADVVSQFDAGADQVQIAERLRDRVFSRGHSRDVLESVEDFLGRPVRVDALLQERGLLGASQTGQ